MVETFQRLNEKIRQARLGKAPITNEMDSSLPVGEFSSSQPVPGSYESAQPVAGAGSTAVDNQPAADLSHTATATAPKDYRFIKLPILLSKTRAS